MISTTSAVVVVLATLGVFLAIGIRARRVASVDDYVTARGSQGTVALGLSFFASGMGAWVLFAPAELGWLLGLDAAVGYGLAAGAPYLVFALVGPRLRRLIPSGHGLTEFLRVRFGRTFSALVLVVAVLYMAVFVTAELTAVAGVAGLLGGVPTAVTVLAVVGATLAYTAVGGLPASLRTDRWQAWLVLALLAVGVAAILLEVDDPAGALSASGRLGADRAGIESAVTLVIAVTAANLFHQGYWQRIWAARDDRSLRRGALLGFAGAVPAVLVAGLLGVLAAGSGAVDDPAAAALSVFALSGALPSVLLAGVLVLGVALVCSSVDTLENGLASLVVAERPRVSLPIARLATVLVMVPCTVGALVADSVLQLFLIADLLAAAIVAPALLGLWRRTTTAAAMLGGLAGLAGALGAGWLDRGSLRGAWEAVTFPDAVPTLAPFLGAVVAGTLVTLVTSVAAGRVADLSDLDAAVRARA